MENKTISFKDYAFFCKVQISKRVCCRADFNKVLKNSKREAGPFFDSCIGRTLYFRFFPMVPESYDEVKQAAEYNEKYGLEFLRVVQKEANIWTKSLNKKIKIKEE